MKKFKKIYWFGVGSNHLRETSVYGGKFIRIPLMRALNKFGYEIEWLGYDCNDYRNSHFINLLDLDGKDWWHYTANISNKSQDLKSSLSKNPGPLLVELRPNIDKPGYNFANEWSTQLELINLFLENKLPVFIWDQDIWCDYIPNEIRKQVILLRPYVKEADSSFINQEEFLYMTFELSEYQQRRLNIISKEEKRFDVMYCGNVYERRNEFLEYFKPFHDNNKRVCIQGNWLRKKYDDRDFSLDNFPNFMFFGSTPHWTTLPCTAMSKSVVHFGNKRQQEAGLLTQRIFEAFVAKTVLFCSNDIYGIETVVPQELCVSSGSKLFDLWNTIDKSDNWEHYRSLFEKKIGAYEFSAEYRALQFEKLIEKYS